MSNYVDMTNEEIWKMLEKKMEKNNILSEPGVLCQGENKLNKLLDPKIIEDKYVTDVYDAAVARYAIVLAYRSGYLRAMKGRPFKFGEKKTNGHWEPVDPKNLPKEGTRVRYSRHIDDIGAEPFSHWSKIQIGEETVVMYAGNEFGVKDIHDIYRNSHFIYSAHHPERFDMWVEDDE